jgi:hypothetical protein
MPVYLMLHPNRSVPFRRGLRGGGGAQVTVFEPRNPIEATQAVCESIVDDVGAAVVLVDVEVDGTVVVNHRVNWKATAGVVLERARELAERQLPMLPHQKAEYIRANNS